VPQPARDGTAPGAQGAGAGGVAPQVDDDRVQAECLRQDLPVAFPLGRAGGGGVTIRGLHQVPGGLPLAREPKQLGRESRREQRATRQWRSGRSARRSH
jgi:hypothetical protein